MTYTQTVTRDGETTTATISDTAALALVHRANRLSAQVTATKDGTVTLTRTRLVFADTDGETRETTTVITLTPDIKPTRLTDTQYGDLGRIRRGTGTARLAEDGSIRVRLSRIPPAAAKRLLDRGLVAADADATVQVTLAGLLAMAAHQHKVWTVGVSETVGGDFTRYHTLTGVRLERTGYFVTAYCTCHRLASHQTERATARRAARTHLEGELTAALIGA